MKSQVAVARKPKTTGAERSGIVDCDVHPMPKSPDEIRSRLSLPWRDRFAAGDRGLFTGQGVSLGHRLDSHPEDGGSPGSDPGLLRSQLIDEFGIAYAILLPRAFAALQPDPDFAAAIAAAYNDWLADTWLGEYNHDGAFKGSITVAQQDPVQAAREIERWAGHPHFVQVMMDSGARVPFGQRQYYPIYEACERHGLPLALHPGNRRAGHQPVSGTGIPDPLHRMEDMLAGGLPGPSGQLPD
jgi:predicted TIM-barrel fold metal-dependent hydrolase